MDRRGRPVSRFLARFRGLIQAAATVLTNRHLSNFANGTIYRGPGKTVCVPGLNCYSCPGAAGACPVGSFQAVAGSSKFRFSYYITGFLILLGVLLGRFICGFLCPFGFFQDLLHKIPTKKLPTGRLKPLRYLKYGVLLIMVVLLPVLVTNELGMGNPFFCKYLCPEGVLAGAIPLSIVNGSIRAALSRLFTWKLSILIAVVAASIVFYRPFCKWLCPLGAFYALFNRVSLLQLQVDGNRCVSCGKCAKVCPMDVDVTKTPNHAECIRCGKCCRACPWDAIRYRYGFGGEQGTEAEDREKEHNNVGFTNSKRRKSKMKNWIKMMLMAVLVVSLAACGNTKAESAEPGLDEVQKQIDEQFDRIDAIIGDHEALWDRLAGDLDEDELTEVQDDSIYSGRMAEVLEKKKDLLTEEEAKTLSDDIEKIREVEAELDRLDKEFAKVAEESGVSLDAENPAPESFPEFEGKDLDGRDVDSSIFSENKVTVVNFWFSGCSPCVGELGLLNELNEKLREKGGAVVGINTDTLDGDEAQIAEAKKILEQKGAAYQNIWFSRASEAGRFADNVIGFPTTYVVDSGGRIVGEPLMGGIDYPEVEGRLQELIQQALGE